MSQRSRSAAKNRPLSALPGPDRQHLLARCQQVKLRFGDVLCRPGQHIRHVLFPADSFVSLITPIDGRARLEVGLVGDEGMLGISLMLGVSAAPLRALVQGAGAAWRMKAAAFCRELKHSPALQQGLNRYLYNAEPVGTDGRLHPLPSRGGAACPLAYTLGVRRAGVTLAASSLRTPCPMQPKCLGLWCRSARRPQR